MVGENLEGDLFIGSSQANHQRNAERTAMHISRGDTVRVMRGDDEIMSCDEVRIFAAHKPEGGIRAVPIPPEFIALCS